MKRKKTYEEQVDELMLGPKTQRLEQALQDIRYICRKDGYTFLSKVLDIHEITGKVLDRHLISDIRSALE